MQESGRTGSSRRGALGPPVRAVLGLSPFLWLLFLVGAAGCQQDDAYELILAPADCALIQGRVVGGNGPLPATVTAKALDEGSSFTGKTGDDGAYAIAVPFGRYTLSALLASSLGYVNFTAAGPSLTQCDTLETSAFSAVAVADFRLGGVRVDLRLPASCVGTEWSVAAEPVGVHRGFWRTQEVLVPDSLRTACVLDGLPAGRVSVTVTGGGVLLPVAEAQEIEIRTGETTPVSLDYPEACTVRATLRGSWPRLVRLTSRDGYGPKVGLEVWTADSVQVADREVPAELDGDVARMEIRLLGRGSVRFRLTAGQRAWWIGGGSFETADNWELQPGATLDLPEIAEAGILCHLEPGLPLPWFPATVSLYDSAGSLVGKGSAPCGWCMDVPGNVVYFYGLDPGSYFPHLDQARCGSFWLSRWYPDAMTRDAAVPVVISSPGQLVEIAWPLVEGGTIAGRIDGVTPSWAAVMLASPADTSVALCNSYTEQPGGAFTFGGLEDGGYILCVDRPAPHVFKHWWYPGSWSAGQAETLYVRDRIGPEFLRWSLE